MDFDASGVGPTMEDAPIEVWMDGGCPLCLASRDWVEARDEDRAVCFRDFRSAADDALPVDRERHERSMWVRTDDGKLVSGFGALREVLRVMPRWRWLGFVTGVPPLNWVGAICYRGVARFRYWWSSLLKPSV